MKVTPQSYAQADALFTTDLNTFKSIVVGTVAQREKHDEQEKKFIGDAPFLGIMLFRAMQEIRVNPTNPAWAGQSDAKAIETLFGKKLDGLSHESSCMKAYRLAYVGDNGPEKFATDEEAAKAGTLVRSAYFKEADYVKASANTLRLVASILTRCEEKPDAMKHPAIVDACEVIKSSSEKKKKELQEILDRLDKKTGEYLSTEEAAAKAKADAEKAESEKTTGFNLGDEADCARMAGTVAKANLGAVLATLLAEARTAESPDVLANFAGTLGGILTARFDKARVLAIMRMAAMSEEAASKANADAVKAGADAGLAPGLALKTA